MSQLARSDSTGADDDAENSVGHDDGEIELTRKESDGRRCSFMEGIEPEDEEPPPSEPRRPLGKLAIRDPSDATGDGLPAAPPQLHIQVIQRRLVFYVLATCLFLVTFSGVSWHGIVIHTVTEPVGVAESRADDLVQLYNTISGFLMALVETLLGMFMVNYFSVFLVHLHNALWFLRDGTMLGRPWPRRLRSVLLVGFPVLMMMALGNSLRSFQATQSTVDFVPVIKTKDLKLHRKSIELIKKYARGNESEARNGTDHPFDPTPLGILKTGAQGFTTPFSIIADSNCGTTNRTKDVDFSLNPHDLDATNVVYGYPPNEWNSEALDELPLPLGHCKLTYSSIIDEDIAPEATNNVSMATAFELFAHGKIILDKGVADTQATYYQCDDYADGDPATAGVGPETSPYRERCRVAYRTLVETGQILANKTLQTPRRLLSLIAGSLSQAVTGFDTSSTKAVIRRYQLTDLVTMDTLEVSGYMPIPEPWDETISFFEDDNRYDFGLWAHEFCGSNNCVFIDNANSFRVPRGVVAMGAQSNCSFSPQTIRYRSDLGAFYPQDCTPETNALVVVGLSTYISGDEYGSNHPTSNSPYIINPRRNLRLVVAKLTWRTEDLSEIYHVGCRRFRLGGGGCRGLALKLRSGRYVFTAEDALPGDVLKSATLENPIPLIQLNEASLYINAWGLEVTPERLLWEEHTNPPFERVRWQKNAFNGTRCSKLMESYLRHIEVNRFYFDRQNENVFRAGLFYLLSNGSVTQLNDTVTFDAPLYNLTNNILNGDRQIRRIQVAVPYSSLRATIGGCVIIFVLGLIVVLFPTRRVEYFPFQTSTAHEYIRMMNSDKYPELVHNKILYFPDTGASRPMDEFVVEEMTLVHRVFRDHEIPLQSKP